jgi:HlyD family secretion protein
VAKQSSGGGSLLGKLMPRPPSQAPKPQDNALDTERHVWTLRVGQLQKIAVTPGMTDGVRTEVKGGTLEPGTPVVVDLAEVKK